jgi:DNA adenine methylase
MSTSSQIVRPEDGVVNVASVAHLSPLRYPGGKTWLVPWVRRWLTGLPRRPRRFVEPFAGGAIIGLTVAAENLAQEVVLCELDQDVASVWEVVLGSDAEHLVDRILKFRMTRDHVIETLERPPRTTVDRAFQTILKNRVNRGGILAPGASLMKNGENGRGVASRWYPETLAKRIRNIQSFAYKIKFIAGDGLELIERYVGQKTTAIFVDPPYTVGGKRAGSRLYRHNDLDHRFLFDRIKLARGPVMLTYDESEEVRRLAKMAQLDVDVVSMKSTHHAVMPELIITNFRVIADTSFEVRLAKKVKMRPVSVPALAESLFPVV